MAMTHGSDAAPGGDGVSGGQKVTKAHHTSCSRRRLFQLPSFLSKTNAENFKKEKSGQGRRGGVESLGSGHSSLSSVVTATTAIALEATMHPSTCLDTGEQLPQRPVPSVAHSLIEAKDWDKLSEYLESDEAKQEILSLDLPSGDASCDQLEQQDTTDSNIPNTGSATDQNSTGTTIPDNGSPAKNPLHQALCSGAPPSIIATLCSIRPSLAAHIDAKGRTALHIACLNWRVSVEEEEARVEARQEQAEEEAMIEAEKQANGEHEIKKIKKLRKKRRSKKKKKKAAPSTEPILTIVKELITTDPSAINRPDGDELCCIETAILSHAPVVVVMLLRMGSETYWKEVVPLGDAACGMALQSVSRKRIVDAAVAKVLKDGGTVTN